MLYKYFHGHSRTAIEVLTVKPWTETTGASTKINLYHLGRRTTMRTILLEPLVRIQCYSYFCYTRPKMPFQHLTNNTSSLLIRSLALTSHRPWSFAGSTISAPTTSSSRSSSSSLRMAGLDVLDETMAEIEKSVAPPGGGFWFGSAGFWGEEDYRGFVDTYKPNNLINVSNALPQR